VKGPILGALVVGATLLASCERKAPGPAECQVFAEIVMTVTEEAARTPPELQQAQLNEHVRSCLTTPYDDELIACVAETRRYRRCQRDFVLRKELER
jgi:hypothetical protein